MPRLHVLVFQSVDGSEPPADAIAAGDSVEVTAQDEVVTIVGDGVVITLGPPPGDASTCVFGPLSQGMGVDVEGGAFARAASVTVTVLAVEDARAQGILLNGRASPKPAQPSGPLGSR